MESAQSTKSDFNVEVVTVRLRPHPNADRLEIADANGTPVVVRKGDFTDGSRAIFVPLDAIVPLSNPEFAFLRRPGHDNDTHARIRAVRLRGTYSEGLLVPRQALYCGPDPLNENIQEALGITKWEPEADRAQYGATTQRTKTQSMQERLANQFMPVYGMDNGRRFPEAIADGTYVIATEKIHGCNARYCYKDGKLWVGSHKTLRGVTRHRLVEAFDRFRLKVRRFFVFAGRTELFENHGDVWWQVAEEFALKEILANAPDMVLYGEIFGHGLQKRGGVSFDYDSPDGLGFVVFDILDTKAPGGPTFMSHAEMVSVCMGLGLSWVPLVYAGAFSKEEINFHTKGSTQLGGGHIREGVVVRTDARQRDPNRVILKYVSEDYKLLAEKDEG